MELAEERQRTGVDLHTVDPGADGTARLESAKPSTSCVDLARPISIGISRLATSATGDGAHRTAWE